MFFGLIFTACLAVSSSAPLPKNILPVIGILTQPRNAAVDWKNTSNVDASYVQFLEMGGAVVVPLMFNATASDTTQTFKKLSAVFFTGGPDKPTDFPRYFETAQLLYSLAIQSGTPIWGTCLGFQMLSDLAAGGADILSDFDAYELGLSLDLTSAAATSRLLGTNTPAYVLDALTEKNVTTNWHHYGVAPSDFDVSVAPAGFMATSTNVDRSGLTFVSSMEHATLPIYAVQWHPEANSFDRDHTTVDHSPSAVLAMQWLASFFVSEARLKGTGPGDLNLGTLKPISSYPTVRIPSDYTQEIYSLKYIFR